MTRYEMKCWSAKMHVYRWTRLVTSVFEKKPQCQRVVGVDMDELGPGFLRLR